MRLALLSDPDAVRPIAILPDITGPRALRIALASIPSRPGGYFVAAELPDAATGRRWWVLHPIRDDGRGSDLRRVLKIESGLTGAASADRSSIEIADAVRRQIEYARSIDGAADFATDWSDQ